jgi:hypothetical protein
LVVRVGCVWVIAGYSGVVRLERLADCMARWDAGDCGAV